MATLSLRQLEAEVALGVKDILAELTFLRMIDQKQELYREENMVRAVYRYGLCWIHLHLLTLDISSFYPVFLLSFSSKASYLFCLRRYEHFWLQLLKKHSFLSGTDSELVAPVDVQWAQHVHLLCPTSYREDLERSVLGRPAGFALARGGKGEARARSLWQAEFPKEPYNLHADGAAPQVPPSAFAYDIVAASQRQQVFFYQVSLPHFQDPTFLKAAISRYAQYLQLQRGHPKQFLVPCYDMDIVWHTHQLNHTKYCADTQRILGRILNHDDSVTEREPGSKLSNASDVTMKLWREHFGEEFRRPGCMYRGPPPQGKLLPLPSSTQHSLLHTRVATVTLSNISCTLPDHWLQNGTVNKVKLTAYLRFNNSVVNFPNLNSKQMAETQGTEGSEGVWNFPDVAQTLIEGTQPVLSLRNTVKLTQPCCFCLTFTKKEFGELLPVNLFPFPGKDEVRQIDAEATSGRFKPVAAGHFKVRLSKMSIITSFCRWI